MSLMDKFTGKTESSTVKEVKKEVEIPEEYTPTFNNVEKPESEATPFVITSEVNAYINDRLKSQPKTIEDIVIKDVEFPEGRHQLSLPPDLEKIFKKRGVDVRWINKDKQAIDRALDVRGWVLATRMLFPEILKHHFTANGVIEHGDSILGFMPSARAARLRAIPGERSNEAVKNLPINKWKNGGESFYKPTLSEEKDGETITSGIQPDRQEMIQAT